MFVAEGQAFGNKPAPAPPGCTAVSPRIPPVWARPRWGIAFTRFRGAEAHCVSSWPVPLNPALRGGLARPGRVAHGIADGRGQSGRLGHQRVVGRSVVLLVEDSRRPCGLVVDEIVATNAPVPPGGDGLRS